jgi:hypothetical protein
LLGEDRRHQAGNSSVKQQQRRTGHARIDRCISLDEILDAIETDTTPANGRNNPAGQADAKTECISHCTYIVSGQNFPGEGQWRERMIASKDGDISLGITNPDFDIDDRAVGELHSGSSAIAEYMIGCNNCPAVTNCECCAFRLVQVCLAGSSNRENRHNGLHRLYSTLASVAGDSWR